MNAATPPARRPFAFFGAHARTYRAQYAAAIAAAARPGILQRVAAFLNLRALQRGEIFSSAHLADSAVSQFGGVTFARDGLANYLLGARLDFLREVTQPARFYLDLGARASTDALRIWLNLHFGR